MTALPDVIVDCDGLTTVGEFWQRYLEAAKPVEDGFGRNLDAFWDAIEAGGPGWPGRCRLVFRGTSNLEGLRLPNGESFLAAFVETARQATQIDIILS